MLLTTYLSLLPALAFCTILIRPERLGQSINMGVTRYVTNPLTAWLEWAETFL